MILSAAKDWVQAQAIKLLAGLALVLAVLLVVQSLQVGSLKLAAAQHAEQDAIALAAAEKAARYKEQQHAQAMADIATKYEEDKAHAQAAIDRLSADLAAGHQRMRQRFTCPVVSPAPGTGAGQPDARAGLLPADVSFLIGIGRRCDTDIRALQAVVRKDRSASSVPAK